MAKFDLFKWKETPYRFHRDLTVKEVDDLGPAPINMAEQKTYQRQLLCALSCDPKLTMADIETMMSKHLSFLLAKVVLKYNQDIEDFLPDDVLQNLRQQIAGQMSKKE